jgi:SH3-like domain-containing protein
LRHRLQIAALALMLITTGACGINLPSTNPTVVVVLPPTNTLAPIVTQTQRFTATPIPSPTLIPTATVPPTETLLPPTDVPIPTATPIPAIKGLIKSDAGIVKMRIGPGTTYRSNANLKAGAPVVISAVSSDLQWMLVQIEDGTEGWVSAQFITPNNPEVTVPALTTPELTQRAVLGTQISQTQTALAPTAEGGLAIDANAPTHVPGIVPASDVLAYCDQRADSLKNRKFTTGQRVTIFWSWIAKTPEQIKDHLNNAQYEVKVNGLILGDWARYASQVRQQNDGSYIVYWFIPLGTPAAGAYKVDFKLTWKQPIFDGVDRFGPGTDKPADTGTCAFTVK